MVPELPTPTNTPLEVVVVVLSVVVEVVEELLSLLLQEKKVKLKRNRERIMRICLTRFPISGLGEPNIYQDLGVFYNVWGFYLEELGQGCRII